MKKFVLLLMLSLSSTGCWLSSSSTTYYTHSDVANIFVNDLYYETYGTVDFDIVKYYTLQGEFIVVQDYYGRYYAIDLSGFNPYYDSASNYYYDPYTIVTQVYWQYDNVYWSPYYGYFEKTQATPKDLAKMKALQEVADIDKRAEFLTSELGLSQERSLEVARLTHNWSKAGIKSMTEAEHDTFASELLGFSITEARHIVDAHNPASVEELIEIAAKTNNITPEHARKLMTKIYNLAQ